MKESMSRGKVKKMQGNNVKKKNISEGEYLKKMYQQGNNERKHISSGKMKENKSAEEKKENVSVGE